MFDVVWEDHMKRNIEKQDGRGRSAGSKAKHFSSDRQPQRRRGRKQKVDPEAAELLHKAIYEKIPGFKNGKKVKIPYIEAFIISMRKNALAAKISEQIKYLKELISLGIFDFEEFKDRLFRGVNNYYKKVLSSARALADGVDELGAAFLQAQMLKIFYFTAFAHARQHCTCGACDRGLEYAEYIVPIVAKAVFAPEEDDSEESDDDDTNEGEAANASAAVASNPTDKIGDDEFYDGFRFD
ncbi:MAG: hypothetical protein APF78_01140 [Sphingomonadales bacterium BRH_c3]|nr:MAG: hypothetical protein APF78_01140 [Sphingomonadales bacterium BRH_c3]